jgi:Ser/Thr protein kinase RdoA (MazF antagonist)
MPHPPYQDLTPDRVLNAVESTGFRCDGRLLALNSFENRVYQIGIEDGPPLVAKFYRPQRWSDEAILEEHGFTVELAEREIPVVAPLADGAGRTLHAFEGFRFALYPRRPGRAPELDDPDTLTWMGRFIGRIHAVGAIRPFQHRPILTVENFGDEPFRYLTENGFIPEDLRAAYGSVVADVLQRVRAGFERAGGVAAIRLHGDCHPGNVLWTDDGPHFVDFDDCAWARRSRTCGCCSPATGRP